MFARTIMVGIAALVFAAPGSAQERGTVEFGAFASSTSFDKELSMNNSWGMGGRVGAFLHPRLSVEFEGGATSASRTQGLSDVNVGVLSARLTAVPLQFDRLSILLGGGIDHTDTHFLESYGAHGLLGAKFALSDVFALRLDGIATYMAHQKFTNMGFHIGIVSYRNPFGRTTTVTRYQRTAQLPDSVSASETRRLRIAADNYDSLRDSLYRARNGPASSAAALATMQTMIYFESDQAALSDSARSLLRDKVTVFRANPAMRIVITGYASQPGTAAHNMALGTKRAEAAKAYLVSQGVDPIRIEIATKGEGDLVVEGPGEIANAENRRGQFRLLIADPFLAPPKR